VAGAELDDVTLSAGDFGFRVATEGEMSPDGVGAHSRAVRRDLHHRELPRDTLRRPG
jgi:hypothetical protein